MSRVIIFSARFPSYHPKAGEPTHFIDKIIKSFQGLGYAIHDIDCLAIDPFPFVDESVQCSCLPKKHTIRAGDRWKVGDKFSPRVWSGKPYRSQMVTLADDIEIKKVWRFEIFEREIYLDNIKQYGLRAWHLSRELAKSDGLSFEDFTAWFQFPKNFSGQIICWDNNVIY